MASKSAILSVRIIADAAKAAAGFNDAEKQVENFSSKMDRVSGVVDKAAGYATVAAGAYIGMAKDFMDSASEMEQSTGAVESVFKGQADQIKALAAEASKSVGLAASDYQNMASVMGSQLMNMGISQGEVVGQTEELISLGADMASMFGGTTADAVGALSSLLRGERDPIERYAVSINQAAVDAKMLEMGLGGLDGEAKKNAETQATLALLFDQTADAQGNFARETDTAAGASQIAAAEWENAKAVLGEQFLPIAVQAAEWLGKIAEVATEHPELFMQIGTAVTIAAGALMGISGTIKVIETASAAFKIFNAVLVANPVGLVVAAVAALAAGLVIAYQESETFRNIVDSGMRVVGDILGWVGDLIKAVGTAFTDPRQAVEEFSRLGVVALEKVDSALEIVRDWLQKVADKSGAPGQLIANSLDRAIGVIQTFVGWLKTAYEWVGNLASSWGAQGGGFRGGTIPDAKAGAAAPDMTMQLARDEILKFSATVPDLTMNQAPPDISAALAPSAERIITGRGAGSPAPTVVYNVEITGQVVDREGTAREIKKLLDDESRRQGW